MDKRLQEMLDHYEIRKTLAEYCQASDRCDEERMRGVYLEDSWDEHGAFRAPGPEFARIMTDQILTTSKTMYHLLGQSLVKIDGDKAGAETYFFAVSRTSENGEERVNQLGGRFVDHLERHEDRWLIKRRVVLRDWTISHPLDHDWETATTLQPGARSNADPAFAALGLVHSGLRNAAE